MTLENRAGLGWLAEPDVLAADSTHVSHRDLFSKIIYNLYRVEPQKNCDAPVVYGAIGGFGDIKRDAVFLYACSY